MTHTFLDPMTHTFLASLTWICSDREARDDDLRAVPGAHVARGVVANRATAAAAPPIAVDDDQDHDPVDDAPDAHLVMAIAAGKISPIFAPSFRTDARISLCLQMLVTFLR